jgi:hypothetical protein
VSVKVLFKQLIPDEPHATHGTLKLDAIKELNLGKAGLPVQII